MKSGHQLAVDPAADEPVLLTVDIGGSWMRMGAVDRNGRLAALERIAHHDEPPTTALCNFLARTSIKHACIAVAGPVVNGRVRMTNRPWQLDAKTLQQTLGLRSVSILNDLQAVACALPVLASNDLQALRGRVDPQSGTVALLAPGTGLGEAFLVVTDNGLLPLPSEGGHAEFAPRGPLQRALLAYWADRLPQVEMETFCSGPGLARLHEFVIADAGANACAAVAATLAAATDPAPAIVAGASAAVGPAACPHCRQSVALWLEILAGEAANLALKVVATGGVCFAGNMVSHVAHLLDSAAFCAHFDGSGALRDLLRTFPLARVECIDAPLLGAARFGLARLPG